MNEFKFDPNNTEGSWPTAMVVDGGEIKKGPKMVATDIVDLYDTDINNPQDAQQFIYATDIWINGEGGGSGTCNVFGGYEGLEVGNITADSMDAGDGFSMIIMSDGTLWGAGDGFHGQLGIGRSDSEVLMFEQEASRSTNWWKVACGANFTLAIKTDGTLWGAGMEIYGEMGFGNDGSPDYYSFQQIDYGEPSMICEDVACGYYHSVILLMFDDGGEPKELYVCGNNSYGQLGTEVFGDHENTFTPVNVQAEIPPFEITKIACGHFHTAVIDSNGSLYTCGLNTYGALGNNSQNNQNVFIEEYTEKGNWIDVSCGADHTLAISDYSEDHSSGTFWATGSNVYGQLGQGSTGNSLIFISPNDKLGNYEKVHCGAVSSMVLTKYGDIYAAGDSSLGQVGLEDDGNLMDLTLVFDPLNTSLDYYLLACGFWHSLALRNSLPNPQYDGLVHTTGLNISGELAQGDLDPLYAFTPAYGLLPISGFVYVDEDTLTPGYGQYDTPFPSIKSCFDWLRNTCAVIEPEITIYLLSNVTITEETSLNHPYGYMITIDGNGHTVTVKYDKTFVAQISNHLLGCSMLLYSDGTIWSCGENYYGELGLGNWNDAFNYTQEILLEKWKHINSNNNYSMAIRDTGHIYGCGINSKGQLGIGNNDSVQTFTQGGNLTSDWKYVSCGYNHTFAIKENDTLWRCGEGTSGQLSNGGVDSNIFTIFETDYWKDVSCGGNFTIGIKFDGTMWGTGSNNRGQLSVGNWTDEYYVFTQEESNSEDWASVSCGPDHTLALKTDGTIWSCGWGSNGNLGHGNYDELHTLTQIGTDNDWIYIFASDSRSTAIKSDGTLWSCGYNRNNSLGIGDYESDNFTVLTQEITNKKWITVSSSFGHSVALRSDGIICGAGISYSGELIGHNERLPVYTPLLYQTKNNNIVLHNCNTIDINDVDIESSITANGTCDTSNNKFIDIACGESHALAINEDFTLWVVGDNSDRQLGLPASGWNLEADWTQIGTEESWIQVAGGAGFSMTVRSNGNIYGCGLNTNGQLGRGNTNSITYFARSGSAYNWKQVSCGQRHSAAVNTNGQLYTTGYNYRGQLGLNDTTQRTSFTRVGENVDWESTSCGEEFTVALKDHGTLWGTGYNNVGQLGLGDTSPRNQFTQIGTAEDWIFVACTRIATYAINSDGELWATGYNYYGSLGVGDSGSGNNRNVLTQEARGDTDWVMVGGTPSAAIAVKRDGSVWTTGNTTSGQLGNGALGSTDVFTQIDIRDDIPVILCAGGSFFQLVVAQEGSIWSTGRGDEGQLGQGYIRTIPDTDDRDVLTYSYGALMVDGHYNKNVDSLFIDIDIEGISVNHNSSLDAIDCILDNIEPHYTGNILMPDMKYSIVKYRSVPLSFYDSVGIIKGILPENVNIDMKSTIDIPDLQYDISNWIAKNNSLVAITDESTHSIDITNENSMVVLNDAQL